MAESARRTREGVDGRLTRTMRSRIAICDASLDLMQEGVLQPSADQIAERAGLSRRSIFYHFSDLGELYDAVVEVGMQRFTPLLKQVPSDASLDERVELLADARARFFEGTTPYSRALTAQCLLGPASDEAIRIVRDSLEKQKSQVERLFAKELARVPASQRAVITEALAAAASAPTWEYLRRSRRLSLTRARNVMKRNLRALLRDLEAETS